MKVLALLIRGLLRVAFVLNLLALAIWGSVLFISPVLDLQALGYVIFLLFTAFALGVLNFHPRYASLC